MERSFGITLAVLATLLVAAPAVAALVARTRRRSRMRQHMIAERTATLERTSAAKTRLLGAASHDLRQPLQAALLFTSTLETVGDARTAPLVEKLAQSLNAMGRLLDGLLDLTKLDGGGVTATFRQMRLDHLLARLAEQIGPLFLAKGLRFQVHLRAIEVQSDPLLLETLIRNLLDNALKYTREGTVLLACRHVRGRPVVEVWDTGVGIAENQLALIFDEFHQVRNAGEGAAPGFGLGLAIVSRLAILLQVEVSVASRSGRGSRFRVSF